MGWIIRPFWDARSSNPMTEGATGQDFLLAYLAFLLLDGDAFYLHRPLGRSAQAESFIRSTLSTVLLPATC